MNNVPAPVTPFFLQAIDQVCPHGYNHCKTCDDVRIHEQAMRHKMFYACPFKIVDHPQFEIYVSDARDSQVRYEVVWHGMSLSDNTISLEEINDYPPYILATHWLGALAAVYSKIKQGTADSLGLYNTGEKHKNSLRDSAQREEYLRKSAAAATALAEKQRAEYERPCLELLGVGVGRDDLINF